MEPFILYGKCSVEYDGRAYSTLESGNYLIIYKSDGTLLIHGSTLATPLNYQSAGGKLTITDDMIICKRKGETISIKLESRPLMLQIPGWSNSKIKLSRTEKELIDKIVANPQEYLGIKPKDIIREYTTKHGPIDLAIRGPDDILHIIEVKRKRATIAAGGQLDRYCQCFDPDRIVGYLASPSISNNTLAYLERRGYKYIKVDFT